MKQKDWNIFRIGLAYFLMLASVIVVQFGATFAVSFIKPSLTSDPNFLVALSVLPIYLVGLPILLLALGKNKSEPIQKKPMKIGWFLVALVVSFGVMLVGNYIGNAIMFIVDLIKYIVHAGSSTNPVEELLSGTNILVSILAMVIIAPIGEEFIFRRLIIDRAKKYGDLPAVLLSALVFAAFHMNLYQFFYAFFLGVVFAYIYIKTGKLRYSICIHALINLISGVFMGILSDYLLQSIADPASLSVWQIVTVILVSLVSISHTLILWLCLITTIVFVFVFRKRISLEKGAGAKKLFLSPMLIAFFILAFVLIVCSMVG